MILTELAKLLDLAPPPLIDAFFSMIRARALIEAQKLRVFDLLAEDPLTAEAAARRLGLDPQGMKVLLEVLTIIGYLRRTRDERYRNTRRSRRWLVETSPDSVGNIVRHAETVWERAPYIEQVLRTGVPPFDFHEQATAEQQESYALANRDFARRMLREFARSVKVPAHARRLIDLGGAHGDFAAALVEGHPKLEATVFDLPPAVAVGQTLAEKQGNPRSLAFQAGDFFHDDIGSGWDMALLNHVIRIFPAERNRALFRIVHQALAPGGQLVITDHLLGFGRAHDMYGHLFTFNLYPVGGQCHHIENVSEQLRASGFTKLRQRRLRHALGSAIVTAEKD
jgi:SAM-dependent methyltransferase